MGDPARVLTQEEVEGQQDLLREHVHIHTLLVASQDQHHLMIHRSQVHLGRVDLHSENRGVTLVVTPTGRHITTNTIQIVATTIAVQNMTVVILVRWD